jgi:hypothetical protein
MNKFTEGVLYSAGYIARYHGETELGRFLIKEAGLTTADCTKLDEFDKVGLRLINQIEDINLIGLD